jgi:hypothetical protein
MRSMTSRGRADFRPDGVVHRAAYLGHGDLSTVSRYAHVAEDELHDAAAALSVRTVTATSREAA